LSGGILEKTNECVWLICLSCPNLEVLNLARSPNLIDVALKPLAKHLLKLHHLDISGKVKSLTQIAIETSLIIVYTIMQHQNLFRNIPKQNIVFVLFI
jgi:myosin-crossreactive antigen